MQGTCRDDDIDPLGILRERSQEQNLNSTIAGNSELLQGSPFLEMISDYRRNPCGTIDAILKRSKDVRELVFSRQANVLDAYNNESRELDKELALLPPTYHQFLVVRAKAASHRRQRSAPLGRSDARPYSVCHPLNFHLTSDVDHNAAYSHFEDRNKEGNREEASSMKGWKEGVRVGEERTAVMGSRDDANSGVAGQSPSKCDVALGFAVDGTKEGADHEVGHGGETNRRCSTIARHGSVTKTAAATQASQHQAESWHDKKRSSRLQRSADWVDDIPALRRSKIRGRDMVFSLLEAARVEEEELENRVFGDSIPDGEADAQQREVTFKELDDARVRNAREFQILMTEYDPRPNNYRLKPRKDLSRPSRTAEGMSTSTSKCGAGRGSIRLTRPRTVSSVQDVSIRYCGTYSAEGDGVEGESIDDTEDREGKEQTPEEKSRKGITGEGVATGHAVVNTDGEEAVRVGPGGNGDRTKPRASGRSVVAAFHDENIQSAKADREKIDGDCREGLLCMDVPARMMPVSTPDAAIEGPIRERPLLCGSDDAGDHATRRKQREDGRDAPVSGRKQETSPEGKQRSTSTRKKPTLPDPNAINGAVMQDPFNMDHMKDLPGLTGSHGRELSLLVSETVSYMDPAFPNLEFHRRMDMDRAGYFMPGYKPRVNSPGPDAGAYWLERRQSYRVKMTDPALSHHIGQHQQSKPTATQRGMKKGARKTRSVTKARARMSSPGREASLLTTGTGITKQEEGVQSSPGEKATRMRMQKGDNATHGVGDPGGGLGQRHRCSPGDRRRGSSGGVDRGMHNSRLRETHPSAIVENG